MSSTGGCPDPSQRLPSALCEGHGLRPQVLDRVPHRAVITSGPVPLENRIRLVTCESSRYQAAREYSFDQAAQDGFSVDPFALEVGNSRATVGGRRRGCAGRCPGAAGPCCSAPGNRPGRCADAPHPELARGRGALGAGYRRAARRSHSCGVPGQRSARSWSRRSGVHRARHPPDVPRRRHREPHRRVDGAAGPQARPHPRRAAGENAVPDPRPRIKLHPVLQRRLPGRRHQDLAHCRSGSPDERDLRTPHRHPAPRAPRPRADPQRGASARHLDRVSGPLQHGRPHQGIAQRVPSCDHEAPRVTATNLNAERITGNRY